MINDVRAFSKEVLLSLLRISDVALCVMHMQGNTDHYATIIRAYDSVVDDVRRFCWMWQILD